MAKRKRGRPPLGKKARSVQVLVRLTEAELQELLEQTGAPDLVHKSTAVYYALQKYLSSSSDIYNEDE